MATGDVFRIGEATLDLGRGTLVVAGQLVGVRSKTFALLSHLARNPGRVVTKDEFFETVWPGLFVSDDSLTQCVRDARKAIGDDDQTILRTVPKRGYLLAEAVSLSEGRSQPEIPTSFAVRLIEPIVAVLPFFGEDSGRASLGIQSFNEELAEAISRFRSVAVIAAASIRKLGPVNDAVEAGRGLGADYCVTGSVSAEDGIAVKVGLVETASGRRIWTDAVRSTSGLLLETPALIATRIVGRLVGSVEADAARRAQRVPTASLQAYAHMISGIALLRQHGEGVNEAGKAELEAAAHLDPGSGLIQAYLALAEAMIARGDPVSPALRAARDRAARACALAPEEARCYRVLAIVLTYRREFAAAEAQYERAIALNPYDADTLAQLGFIRAARGHPEEALEMMARAAQLNPLHPDWYHLDRHSPLFMLGRFVEAAECLERIPHLTARQHAYVAACYALDGQNERAAKSLADAFRKNPELDVASLTENMEWERAEHRAMLAEGLRLAGDKLAGRMA